MDYLIVVWVDNNTQVQRVKLRDRLSRDEAINRINSQLSLDTKVTFADVIIDNNKDLVSTKDQVDSLVDFLKKIC